MLERSRSMDKRMTHGYYFQAIEIWRHTLAIFLKYFSFYNNDTLGLNKPSDSVKKVLFELLYILNLNLSTQVKFKQAKPQFNLI